jgi:hypothetical protein
MFHCEEKLHFVQDGTPTRLVFSFRVWLEKFSVGGLGIKVSALTFV